MIKVSKKSRKRKTKKNFKDEKDNANEIVGDHITSQDEIGTSGSAIPPVDSSNTEPTSQANDGKENVSEPLQVNKEHTPNVGENSGSNKQENVSEPFQVDKDDAPEVEAANSGSNMQDNVSEPLQVDQEDAPDVEAVDPEGDMPEMEGNNNNGIEDYGADDSSEGEQQLGHLDEVDFKISTLISALANTTIIQRLCWLLKFYKINSSSTNHYIICMLQRICDDLELSPMLYQVKVLLNNSIIYDKQYLVGIENMEICLALMFLSTCAAVTPYHISQYSGRAENNSMQRIQKHC